MKTCKNDNKPVLAFGLCRACYDATPERLAKRSKATLTAHRFKSYKNTPEFKAWVAKYKETEDFKKWQLEKFKYDYKGKQKTTRIFSTTNRALYMREYRKRQTVSPQE